MARKKTAGEGQPRKHGTLVRVTDRFADALRKAAGFEGLSQGEYADKHLLPVIERQYRDAVLEEAKRLEGKPPRR